MYVCSDFQNRFPKSIKTHRVGFMNPNHDASPSNTSKKHITYKEVCQGKSGYVEVLLLELHDPETHFEDVIRFFFGIHDPTTINRQGADRGTQYSSFIFCADQGQQKIVRKVMKELEHLLSWRHSVLRAQGNPNKSRGLDSLYRSNGTPSRVFE
jgi:methionine-S-sulfoxide reductase